MAGKESNYKEAARCWKGAGGFFVPSIMLQPRGKSLAAPWLICSPVVATTGQIEIGIEKMTLGHEKLDVYRLSIGYVAWVYEKAGVLNGVHRAARDQWLRASQSIPLNIADGNGKTAEADRRRYFEIARGSALECAAIQDVLVVGKALREAESQSRKAELDRIAAMLSRLGGRGYQVGEDQAGYSNGKNDFDPDSDFDLTMNSPDQAFQATPDSAPECGRRAYSL